MQMHFRLVVIIEPNMNPESDVMTKLFIELLKQILRRAFKISELIIFKRCYCTMLLISSCLLAANFIGCWSLQAVWTQIRPNRKPGLIWIQTVWHSDAIVDPVWTQISLNREPGLIWIQAVWLSKEYLKKIMLKNICRQQKNHEKLPSIQEVNFSVDFRRYRRWI